MSLNFIILFPQILFNYICDLCRIETVWNLSWSKELISLSNCLLVETESLNKIYELFKYLDH